MRVLSFFDGMSCGQIALQKLGVTPETYYACEIDKFAMQITQKNYPNTIQLGDVTKVKGLDLPKIDLFIGGSPCQGFSFAGKQLNFEDPRSKLFFEYVRVLEELRVKNPQIKFLLENVKMKKEYRDVISKYLGVQPVFIDSSNFSSHNRPRYYWTNITNLEEMKRTDSGLVISDILSNDITDKLYLNQDQINRGVLKNKAQVFKSGSKCGAVEFPTSINKKVKSLTVVNIKGSREVTHIQDEKGIRVLSRNEREKAQNVPIGYTDCVSEEEAFKMLGNGWTVGVIKYIFSFLE